MNPSASGWIQKLNTVLERELHFLNTTEASFYSALRTCGFIYGTNLSVVFNFLAKEKLTEDELCKVNLYLSFRFVFEQKGLKIDFFDSVIAFYKNIGAYKLSFFKELLRNSSIEGQLEDIIHSRSQIDDNIITKNFNYFLINGLLYIDVLAYSAYLENKTVSLNYLKQLEASIEVISLNVVTSKRIKTEYDESLIKLFESSLRYGNTTNVNYTTAVSNITTIQEKKYILDLACMATWNDQRIALAEQRFLLQLAHDLELNLSTLNASVSAVNEFYSLNKDHIALFSSKTLVQSFYTNSSNMVTKLISRNSKRLYEELVGSKELMVLLTLSTVRELTPKEQKKVQDQLLDIFKSIPSLAIFLLPGGALLLPLVIKFIPKLLPSAFDDNRIEKDNI
jgi:hypothetical protein